MLVCLHRWHSLGRMGFFDMSPDISILPSVCGFTGWTGVGLGVESVEALGFDRETVDKLEALPVCPDLVSQRRVVNIVQIPIAPAINASNAWPVTRSKSPRRAPKWSLRIAWTTR